MRAQAVPLVMGVRERPSSVDLPQYAWHWPAWHWPGMALARHGSVDLPQYARRGLHGAQWECCWLRARRALAVVREVWGLCARARSRMCWHGGGVIEAGMSASMPELAATTGIAVGSG